MSDRKPAEVFHLADYLQEEMDARGWTLDDVAVRMTARQLCINKLALELFFAVREKNVVLGNMGNDLAEAFGVSPEFLNNMHEAWRKQQ